MGQAGRQGLSLEGACKEGRGAGRQTGAVLRGSLQGGQGGMHAGRQAGAVLGGRLQGGQGGRQAGRGCSRAVAYGKISQVVHRTLQPWT